MQALWSDIGGAVICAAFILTVVAATHFLFRED